MSLASPLSWFGMAMILLLLLLSHHTTLVSPTSASAANIGGSLNSSLTNRKNTESSRAFPFRHQKINFTMVENTAAWEKTVIVVTGGRMGSTLVSGLVTCGLEPGCSEQKGPRTTMVSYHILLFTTAAVFLFLSVSLTLLSFDVCMHVCVAGIQPRRLHGR